MSRKYIFLPGILVLFFFCNNSYSQVNTKNADGSYNRYGYREWSESQKSKEVTESSRKALSKSETYKTTASQNNVQKRKIENSIQPSADEERNNTCISGNCVNGYGIKQGMPMMDYRYEGGFKNSKFHGQGKIYDYEGYLIFDGTFENGDKMEGKLIEYSKMRLSGNGTITHLNDYLKTIYVGDFEEKGKGYMAKYDKDGFLQSVYEGECRFGRPKGKGILIHYAGSTYLGYYVGSVSGLLRDGYGVDSSYGGVYVGNYRLGNEQGEGVLFQNPVKGALPIVKYAGNWELGSKSGKGEDYDSTGKIQYEGNFALNKRHGAGTFYKPDGTKVEGTWENGVNAIIDPSSAPEPVVFLKEIDENFNNGNINKWVNDGDYAKLGKGYYHLKTLSQKLPGKLNFQANDDWFFEATMDKKEGHQGVDYGIGWDGGDLMINEYGRANFKYKYGLGKGDGTYVKCNVGKGKNTVQVIKKGDTIEAKVNGKSIFKGEAMNMKTESLYLKLGDWSGMEVQYTHVVFKLLVK